ncbi:MAG: MATE family efflux transporter [Oscillospiraceae bacterium]|nr:MATE family efflux transporter [Oscillospiraceae bacterium]
MTIRLSDHFSYGRLLRFAAPSILMMVFTSIYGVVDGYFISNYIGKIPFAAVNFIMPFLMLLGALGFMVGAGGSALIGKYLGEGKTEDAKRLFSFLIYLTIVSGVVVAAAGELVLRPVALALGADETMLPGCVRYGRIILIGLPALMLQFAFQSFYVTAERPQMGLYVTLSAGGMNMLLDWLLVGVLRLDIEGAAFATIISQFVGGYLPMIYFFFPNSSLLRLGKARFDGRALAKVLGNGSSEFVSNISMSVVTMLYNAQLMKLAGENGVAAYGALMYVCFIFISIFVGYAVGTAPIISFHFGAQNPAELKSLLQKSLRMLAGFALLMLLAGELLAKPLSVLYVGYDSELMHMTIRAFRITSISFFFAAFPIFGSSFFTALNDGKSSALISFLRQFVFQIGAVLLLPLAFGLDGVWFSNVFAEFAATLLTAGFLIGKRKQYHY